MDSISALPMDLVIRILSILPTKDLVRTSVLSKHFKHVWRYVSKLHFVGTHDHDSEQLRVFLNEKLNTQICIENFGIELHSGVSNFENIKEWLEYVLSHQVHEILVLYEPYADPKDILPSSLFSSNSLVNLKLSGSVTLDVPDMASLPSLHLLKLDELSGLSRESFERLLSICPVLEDLEVIFLDDGPSTEFSVIVPLLKRLKIYIPGTMTWFDMKTPLLSHMYFNAFGENMHVAFEKMDHLEEAFINVGDVDITNIIPAITSVNKLTVCGLKQTYFDNFSFNHVEYLKICDCGHSGVHVSSLLRNCPNVQRLEVFIMRGHFPKYVGNAENWNSLHWPPSCILSNLEIFNWSDFWGYETAESAVRYILGNAPVLKHVRISLRSDVHQKGVMVKMIQEFRRASPECELVILS